MRKKNSNEIIAPAIEESKRVMISYRKDLNTLITLMTKDVMNNLVAFLRTNRNQFVADSFSMDLRDLVNGVKRKYRDITPAASRIASEAVIGEARDNTKKFDKGMERITGGISLGRVLTQEGLNDVIQTQIATNVDLIQSIPDQYFKQISTIIYQGVSEGQKVGNITREIQKVTGTTRNRAKLIARDQIQKTNSLITQQRQADLGVQEYVWQTSRDDRVRPTHVANNGKTFRWDSPPPKTGHPGHDINCRCVARAIIPL